MQLEVFFDSRIAVVNHKRVQDYVLHRGDITRVTIEMYDYCWHCAIVNMLLASLIFHCFRLSILTLAKKSSLLSSFCKRRENISIFFSSSSSYTETSNGEQQMISFFSFRERKKQQKHFLSINFSSLRFIFAFFFLFCLQERDSRFFSS